MLRKFIPRGSVGDAAKVGQSIWRAVAGDATI
jgi:hypothetical protein